MGQKPIIFLAEGNKYSGHKCPKILANHAICHTLVCYLQPLDQVQQIE